MTGICGLLNASIDLRIEPLGGAFSKVLWEAFHDVEINEQGGTVGGCGVCNKPFGTSASSCRAIHRCGSGRY
jgi:hypothetical protein